MKTILSLSTASLLVIAPAQAASINIDFNFSGNLPSSSFGGDASQPGTWNSIVSGGATPLEDIAGLPIASTTIQAGGFNESPGSDPLLGDIIRNRAAFGGSEWNFVINDLEPGAYVFWVYAGPLGSGGFSVETDGSTTLETSIASGTSRAIPLTVTAGNRVFFETTEDTSVELGIAGLQIVAVPEPSSSLLALGSLVGGLFLRRR